MLLCSVDLSAAPRRQKRRHGNAPRVVRTGAPATAADTTPLRSGESAPLPPPYVETTAAIMEREAHAPHLTTPTPPGRELIYPDRSKLPQNPSSPPAGSFGDFGKRPAVGFTSGPFAAQTVGTNVTGATLSGTNATFSFPPDSMGAVGPSQFILAVNGRIVTFNKTTGAQDGVLNTTTDIFFKPVQNAAGTSDPRIRYDRLSGRWFMVIVNLETPNRICMAMSDAASAGMITPNTLWSEYFFSNRAGATCFADYPTLGVDANALYIGVNEFCGVYEDYAGADGYVIPKAPLLAGSNVSVTRFALVDGAYGTGPYTPQGVDNYDPNAAEGYFIGVDNLSFGTLILKRVLNPGTTPTVSQDLPITVAETSVARTVPHRGNGNGTNGYLDGLDDRLMMAHLRNGRLWTAQNINVAYNGVATSYDDTSGRNAVRWYELWGVESGSDPHVFQSGTLYDSTQDVTAARHFWMPSIMVNGQGHAALGFSSAGNQFYIDAVATGRWSSDALGTLQSLSMLTAANAAYNPFGDSGSSYGRRWGDYSYTSVDPIDDMTMWTVQEFCDVQSSYGVRITKLVPPPPAIPISTSPAAIALGLSSANVTITGSTASGRGFFDPGSNLPSPARAFSHISATAGGGVKVNSVSYSSPGAVILNIDTTTTAGGAVNVTITNPDGQSATGTGILKVGTAPSITCPTTLNVNSGPVESSCGTAVAFTGITAATATGAPAPAISYSQPSGSVFPVGTTAVTATATNGVGTSSCSFNVVVADRTPPAMSCQHIDVPVARGWTDPLPVDFTVAASDACSSVTTASNPPSGSTFPVGTTTVSASATDAAGNTANCSFTVTVQQGNALYLVTPCRLIDTRNADGPFGGPVAAPNGVRNIAAAGHCGIAADAKSLVYNVTAVTPSNGGWLILYPGNTPLPFVSSINYAAGKTRGNNGTVPIGADGSINLFNSGPDAVHFVIDVTGYFR